MGWPCLTVLGSMALAVPVAVQNPPCPLMTQKGPPGTSEPRHKVASTGLTRQDAHRCPVCCTSRGALGQQDAVALGAAFATSTPVSTQPCRERGRRAVITGALAAQPGHRSMKPLPVIRSLSSSENITIWSILGGTADIKRDLRLQHVLLCFHSALGSNCSLCQHCLRRGGRGRAGKGEMGECTCPLAQDPHPDRC